MATVYCPGLCHTESSVSADSTTSSKLSQDQRTIEVGSELWGLAAPTPLLRWVAQDCVLTVNYFFPMSRWNFPCSNFYLLCLQSPHIPVQKIPLPTLHLPFSYWKTAISSSLSLPCSRLNKPHFFNVSLCIRFLNPLINLMTLYWALSSSSVSFLSCRTGLIIPGVSWWAPRVIMTTLKLLGYLWLM